MMPLIYLAETCGYHFFNIFPTWYEFICDPKTNQPVINSLSDIWLIVAAVIEILLRLASLAAVIFIIYGGIMYTTSQGSPDQTKQARNTMIDALIGLLLAITSSVLIAFIAGQFQS